MNSGFYAGGDHPSEKQRKRMWSAVAKTLPRRPFIFIPDLRSFSYGVAAAAVVYFAAVGVSATVGTMVAGGKPEAVRLDEAYQSAIEQLERVAPRAVANRDGVAAPSLAARHSELDNINAAIRDLQALTGGRDLSPLKQKRLRQLYSLKLQVLQDMIENGEIEL
jgi:hypothetical protein